MISESTEFLRQYGQIGIFVVYGIVFTVIGLGAAWLFRTRNSDPLLLTTYECGPETVGPAWVGFNIRFYIFALLFVLFDVETLFIIPWAVAYKSLGLLGFIEMAIFITVLVLGLLYAWRKGALKWE